MLMATFLRLQGTSSAGPFPEFAMSPPTVYLARRNPIRNQTTPEETLILSCPSRDNQSRGSSEAQGTKAEKIDMGCNIRDMFLDRLCPGAPGRDYI